MRNGAESNAEPDPVKVGEGNAGKIKRLDVINAFGAAEDVRPLADDSFDDNPKGERDHRQIGALHAQRGPSNQDAAERGNQSGRTKGEPRVEIERRRCEGRGVCTRGKEPSLPKRLLTRIADQDIHPGRAQIVDANHERDSQVIVVADGGSQRSDGQGNRDDADDMGKAHQTFSTMPTPSSPWGRSARTKITSRKTTISLHCACQRFTRDSRTPSANPPSTHPRGLESPPMIAPENPFSAIARPTYSEADAIGAMRKPLRPASAELRKNAPTMTAVTLMPMRLAIRWSCATARIALPMMVCCITQSSVAITTTATTNIRIS